MNLGVVRSLKIIVIIFWKFAVENITLDLYYYRKIMTIIILLHVKCTSILKKKNVIKKNTVLCIIGRYPKLYTGRKQILCKGRKRDIGR